MKVLVGCECSGLIRDAFRSKGHRAISCDLQDTEKPGPHYKGNIFDIINHGFDLFICHPPCTYIANSGAQWMSHPDDKDLPFEQRRPNPFYPTRREDQKKAIEFFRLLWEAPIPHKCFENPLPMTSLTDVVGEYTQVIQPWMFGDSFSKPTCLWLSNLPQLKNTNSDPSQKITKGSFTTFSSGKKQPEWYAKAKVNNKEDTQRERSRTFPGMALAMAEQWNDILDYKDTKQLNIFDL